MQRMEDAKNYEKETFNFSFALDLIRNQAYRHVNVKEVSAKAYNLNHFKIVDFTLFFSHIAQAQTC